jgi:outer membrane protein TolC
MRTLCCALTIACALTAPANAQPFDALRAAPSQVEGQDAARPITLDEAIQQGLANSKRIAELQARVDAAGFVVTENRVADYPAVSLQGGYMRTNHVDEFAVIAPGPSRVVVYPDIPDNFRTRLDLQWPIYTGGRVDALTRAAEAERSASTEDLAAARGDLKLEITRSYWALVTARETAAVLDRSVQVMVAHVGDLRTRLEQGLIPPNDLLSAQAQESHERVLAVGAANQRAVAEADLKRLIGLESDAPLNPTTPLVAEAAAAASPVAELIAQALKLRPERRALEQRAASADLRAAAAGSAKLPQIAVGAGYDYARPNPRVFPRNTEWNTSWDASVSLSWSLWDAGRRGAQQGEARAMASALRYRVEDFDRSLSFEIRQRSLELDSSRAAVAASEDGLRAAVESERVVNERYHAGVATTTDVLDAQVARLQAELDRMRALANVRLAEARLTRARGL